MPAAVASARRAALLALKLQTLVRDHAGPGPVAPSPFPGGAALLRDGEAWVLIEDHPERGLGPAMAWADRQGVTKVNLLVEDEGGLLARRAAAFRPAPAVWEVDGRALRAAPPSPRPTPAEIAPDLAALRTVIGAAGADPIEEHGVLSGEVVGLEVCRAVRDDDGTPRLAVGIGAHDREAFRLVHGDAPVGPALAGVVADVAAHRRPGAPPHALNRLARERALRWRLVEDPALVGLVSLAPVPPPVPRANLSDPVPCVALGTAPDGVPVVVVCSAGVDLDIVAFAADARDATIGPTGRLLLAVPEGDDHPVTRLLAGRLAVPAEVAAIPPARAAA